MKHINPTLNGLVLIFFFLLLACNQVETKKRDTHNTIEKRVDSVLALMTIEEKIGQMNQYNGFWDVTGPTPKNGDAKIKYEHLKAGWVGSMLNVHGAEQVRAVQEIAVNETRLGIPLIIGFDVIHGYKTISPIPLAESASWDLKLIKESSAMAAKEAASAGINWTFAPMIDISRDARWGRVMEGAGEDTFLGSKIGKARIYGFQGKDLSDKTSIAACAKHFAGYGFAEAGRDYNTVDVGKNTLHNVILPPFKEAIEADVKTFMNSFNELNGIPATGNKYLQRELLKDDWNFNGFVVSDWGSIIEMKNHGHARDGKHATEIAVNAGSDMDMESHLYVKHIKSLVEEGKIDLKKIDDAVKRILTVKFELGLFDDPFKYCDVSYQDKILHSKENHKTVLEMAKNSIVLLKNENNLLPLKKENEHFAFIGPLVKDKDSPLGSWSLAADRNSAISVWEGVQNYSENKYSFAEGVKLTKGKPNFITETKINTTDRSAMKQAIALAKRVETVVMVLGENAFQSGEGRSRTSLDLPGLQEELLKKIYEVNKNIVLVLMNGRPLTINWAKDHIPAIVEAWHLGSESGNAIAQVLFGDHNPSGKLPMTFPKNVGQIPIYYNHKNTGRPVIPAPDQVFWSHYIDESNEPLYEFGYGLSYTSFEYSNITLDKNTLRAEDYLTVSFTLSNTGKRSGSEIVQLYIKDLFASVTRPIKELKGFKKIKLSPGESKEVHFKIAKKDLCFFNNEEWIAEPGQFDVYVGGSSNTSLSASFSYEE